MGHPRDMSDGPQHHSSSSSTKATFSGMTALIGVVSLIVAIISVAVPYWGYYAPGGASYYAAGLASQDNTGNFGPFQSCKNVAYYTYCGGNDIYKASTWLIVAGISAIVTVITMAVFALFAILHVAMQLQRKEIMVSFPRAIFLKVVAAAIAVVSSVAAVILGALEFTVGKRSSPIDIRMGICYYLQIVLIFVSVLLVVLSYYSYRKYRKNPQLLHIASRRSSSSAPPSYDNQRSNGSGGVSVTQASGSPYIHGRPRLPVQQPQHLQQQPQQQQMQYPQYTFSTSGLPTAAAAGSPQQQLELQQLQLQQNQQLLNGQAAYLQQTMINNGFTPATLTVPTNSMSMQLQQQSLPVQAIRPIQPVQGVPQIQVTQPSPGGVLGASGGTLGRAGGGGVSFAPGGRGGAAQTNVGYNKMSSGPKGAGSMESLDSTQSLTLSTYSYGSSTSTGSFHPLPLRSSLKKPKNKDTSITSDSSSKRVRYGLGGEQTNV